MTANPPHVQHWFAVGLVAYPPSMDSVWAPGASEPELIMNELWPSDLVDVDGHQMLFMPAGIVMENHPHGVGVMATEFEGDNESVVGQMERLFLSQLRGIAFQVGSALHVNRAILVASTTGLRAGQILPTIHMPSGLRAPAFRRTQASAPTGHAGPATARASGPESRLVDRALEWYLKGIGAPFEADVFMFLWIAMEMLSSMDNSIAVVEPTRLRCQHEVSNCPECDKPTDQVRQGPTRKAFLIKHGVDAGEADEMWSVRQMFHGKHDLTDELVNKLAYFGVQLRRVVERELATHFTIAEADDHRTGARGVILPAELGTVYGGQPVEHIVAQAYEMYCELMTPAGQDS